MEDVVGAAVVGAFCLGALAGIAVSCIYWMGRVETRAEEMYRMWVRRERRQRQKQPPRWRDPREPYTGA